MKYIAPTLVFASVATIGVVQIPPIKQYLKESYLAQTRGYTTQSFVKTHAEPTLYLDAIKREKNIAFCNTAYQNQMRVIANHAHFDSKQLTGQINQASQDLTDCILKAKE